MLSRCVRCMLVTSNFQERSFLNLCVGCEAMRNRNTNSLDQGCVVSHHIMRLLLSDFTLAVSPCSGLFWATSESISFWRTHRNDKGSRAHNECKGQDTRRKQRVLHVSRTDNASLNTRSATQVIRLSPPQASNVCNLRSFCEADSRQSRGRRVRVVP
eukprot:3917612-Amphidinium_carterae.1